MNRWTRIAAAIAAFIALLASASPASAQPVQPLPNEGVIAMTKRVCGSSASWREQAERNGLSGNMWLYLGKTYDIQCSATVRTTVTPAGPPSGVWFHPLPGTCRPASGGGQYLAPRSGYLHQGIDLGGIENYRVGTPIHAIGGGTITYAGYSGNAGNQIHQRIGNNVLVKYNHLNNFRRTGGWVAPNEVIAYMGDTGNATGPHLHIEIWVGGHHVDPGAFLANVGVNIRC